MRWPVIEIAEWEELRQCPKCNMTWIQVWPEELEAPPILCRTIPENIDKLRDMDRAATLRPYFLHALSEHMGDLKEERAPCSKPGCDRRKLLSGTMCLEHTIAERFGRQMAFLDRRQR